MATDEYDLRVANGAGSESSLFVGRTEIRIPDQDGDDNPPTSKTLSFERKRNAGAQTVQDGDDLGTLQWKGFDSAGLIPAAAIKAIVDGTPGVNDMPGKLLLQTTKDGASSPTTRLTVKYLNTTELLWDHAIQAAEPVLSANGAMAVWEDSDDGNRTFLLIRTNGTTKSVELT